MITTTTVTNILPILSLSLVTMLWFLKRSKPAPVPEQAVHRLISESKTSKKKWILVKYRPAVSLEQAARNVGRPITEEERLIAFKAKLSFVSQARNNVAVFYSKDKGFVCARRGVMVFVLREYGISGFDTWSSLARALRVEGFEVHSLDGPQISTPSDWATCSALMDGGAWRLHFENATLLFDFGEMDEAQIECEIARDLARIEGKLVGEALALMELGRCKIAQGNLEAADCDLRDAYKKAKASGHPGVIANVLDARGSLYRDIGQLEQAIDQFDRALEICYDTPLASLDGIGTVSANLARTYLYRNRPGGEDPNGAERILTKAARTLQAYPAASFQGAIRTWQMLALVYIQKGVLEKAIDCLEYTLRLKQEMTSLPSPSIEQLGKTRRTVSDLLPILDYLSQELHSAMGSQDIHSQISVHFFKAKAHVELATRILQEKSRGSIDPTRLRLLSKDYDWHLRQAHQLFADGVKILEDELRARVSEPETRITFFEYRLDAYDQMVLLCLTLGQPAESIEYVERAKSRVFLDQLATRATGSRAKIRPGLVADPLTFESVRSYLRNE